MERQKFLQSAFCALACICVGNAAYASATAFKDKTHLVKKSNDRVFTVEMEQEFLKLYKNFANFLKTLIERLGRENAINVWRDAFRHYDETGMNELLYTGWTQKEDIEGNHEDEKINTILEIFFSSPVEEFTKN
jgi:hypothetical protein